MSPSIDKAFNLWSKAVPLLKIKQQRCIREQHLVAGKDGADPTWFPPHPGCIQGQLPPLPREW